MDCEYLKKSVSPALEKGLAQIVVEQPKDPLEFLGDYLMEYVSKMEKEKKNQEYMKEMEEREKVEQEEEKRVKAEEDAQRLLQENKQKANNEMEGRLKQASEVLEAMPTLLEYIKVGIME